jgi:hypothetical protein
VTASIHRADEDPDQAEGDQAADHAGEYQKQRQVGSPLDEDRPARCRAA